MFQETLLVSSETRTTDWELGAGGAAYGRSGMLTVTDLDGVTPLNAPFTVAEKDRCAAVLYSFGP